MHVQNALISVLSLCVSASFTVSALADTTDHRSKSAHTAVSPKRLAYSFEQHTASLQLWMEQAYTSNPSELQKSTQVSPREMVDWVFHGPFNWKFDAIQSLQSSDALKLSLSDDFPGDRILAFTTGTYTLLSPYFQSVHPDEILENQPISERMLEIKITLDALLQNSHNPASNITLSVAEYESFTTLLRKVESDVHTAQR